MYALGNRCREAAVQPSVGSAGDAHDNAMCESFLATLKCELIDRVRTRTREEAEQAVFEFIEGWRNLHGRHSSLNYECPIGYEEKHWGVALATSPDVSAETGKLQAASGRDGRGIRCWTPQARRQNDDCANA
jgi:putative transposase